LWNLSRFEPSEVIDLAAEIEKKGAEFYRRLADKCEHLEAKKLLSYLAAEEDRHQADFIKLGEDFEGTNPRESYPGEYFDYMKSTAETHMFNDDHRLTRMVDDAVSPEEILLLAASFEKDSILFFIGFRRFTSKNKQQVVDDLIREEEGHLQKLAVLRRQIGEE